MREPHEPRTRPCTESYARVRRLTEQLAEPLSAEDQTVQSMADVSPTKWHRGHTTWFFETFVLEPHAPRYRPYDPNYRYLFNSYYEAVGPRHPRPERGLLSRPGVAAVAAYRGHVDDAMAELLATEPTEPVAELVELGLHHEQQHQELMLMDIKHVLSCNPLGPAYHDPPPAPATPPGPLGYTAFDGGLVQIGHDGNGFAFDNEHPRHTVYLEPFELAERPVTNGDWMAFIDDGGYQRPELWLSDGWATVCAAGWEAPLYWRREPQGWSSFTLAGRHPVDPAEPVCHVSYYEADAFARWAGARLASEAEWEHAVASWEASGGCFPDRVFDQAVLHPRPHWGAGPDRWLGQVWEWTASPYVSYPGFRPAAGAVGEYNGKFMINQQVLRGGCCVTPPGHARPTYRNFFPPGARWPFAGLRLARDR